MSHLVIHCGGPKTGSSALQYTLGTSREALAAHHLDYPLVTDETDPSRPSTGNASSIPRQWKEPAAPEGGPNVFEERTQALLARLKAIPPGQTVILSSEYFSDLTCAEWHKVFDLLAPLKRRISAITYFRRQVDQVNSIFGQFIKSGFRPEPRNFVTYSLGEHLCLAPHAWLERAKALPFAGVDLAAYDRHALAAGDITTDFLTRVARLTGAAVPPLRTTPEVNPSFNGEALSLKFWLNIAAPTMPENYAILAVLERIPEFRAGARGPQLVLPREEVERIERRFAEDNARAVETLGPSFRSLLAPRPDTVEFVDVTRPPSPRACALFWRHWADAERTESPFRRGIMAGLAPRLEAALAEARAPALT